MLLLQPVMKETPAAVVVVVGQVATSASSRLESRLACCHRHSRRAESD